MENQLFMVWRNTPHTLQGNDAQQMAANAVAFARQNHVPLYGKVPIYNPQTMTLRAEVKHWPGIGYWVDWSVDVPKQEDHCSRCGKPWSEHEFAVPAPYCP